MIVDRDFPDHWKTRLVIGALGYSAVGGILRLWAHCEARRDDTFEMTPEVLKAVTQIDAKPAEIERALIDARFIERRRKAVYVRGWREKNARLLANIANGRRGGRPQKANRQPTVSDDKPSGNPSVSPTDTQANPAISKERRVEESRVEPPPPRALARARETAAVKVEAPDFETLILAKKRMSRVLGLDPTRAWSPDAEQALMSLVPIPEDEWLAVEWLHRQPADGDRRPKLRTTPTTLTRHWSDEVSKALAFARDQGAVIVASEKNNEPPADPEGWQEWLSERGWPSVAFAEADAGVRREFREKTPRPEGVPA